MKYGGLSIEVSRTPGRLVVTTAGELDIATCHGLTEAVSDLEAAGVGRPMIVEFQMRKLWFVDTSGLATLMALRSRVHAVLLVDPPAHLLHLLEETGVGTMFDIRRSCADDVLE